MALTNLQTFQEARSCDLHLARLAGRVLRAADPKRPLCGHDAQPAKRAARPEQLQRDQLRGKLCRGVRFGLARLLHLRA